MRLELGPPVGKAGDGSFLARLTGRPDGPSAQVDVYDFHYDTLPNFFEDLAEHWKGFAGTKSWYSLENHMMLDATSDKLGHVFLRVTLSIMDGPSDWEVKATLLVEAGQLDRLAREARNVFDAAVV